MTKADAADLRNLIDRVAKTKLEFYQKQKQLEQATNQLDDFILKHTDEN